MDIRISRESPIPPRQQLAEQIVFLIATDKLRPGQALPSVRELAQTVTFQRLRPPTSAWRGGQLLVRG